MDPTFFSIVSTGIKTGTTLRNFVRNELGALLQQLGGKEAEAARMLLQWSSQDKIEERRCIVDIAIFLGEAWRKYRIDARSSLTNSASEPAISWWNGSVLLSPRFLAYQNACGALILAAICFKYLNEMQAMEGILEEAKILFDEYQERVHSTIELFNRLSTIAYHASGLGGGAVAGLATGNISSFGVGRGATLGVVRLGNELLGEFRLGREATNLRAATLLQLQEQEKMFNDILASLR
jgi:hypothetical protein